MDRSGVATAVLSGITGMNADTDPKDETVRRARLTNEFGTKVVADHKGRFGVFATLPLPHIDESLKEIEYAFDTLKADGVFVWTNYGDHWLGEKAFSKVFDELHRRKAVVYTHYAQSPCCFGRQPDTQLQPETPVLRKIEMPTNTTRAIWSLIYDGEPGRNTQSAATRHSDVTFIWSHAGGSLVGLAGQFLGAPTAAEVLAKVPEKNSMLYHLRRFYYDTAQHGEHRIILEGHWTKPPAKQVGTLADRGEVGKHFQRYGLPPAEGANSSS